MKMKKVIALLLASALSLSMAVTSFAADSKSPEPTKPPVTETPAPTETPDPTETPAPTETPDPTETPTPTPVKTPSKDQNVSKVETKPSTINPDVDEVAPTAGTATSNSGYTANGNNFLKAEAIPTIYSQVVKKAIETDTSVLNTLLTAEKSAELADKLGVSDLSDLKTDDVKILSIGDYTLTDENGNVVENFFEENGSTEIYLNVGTVDGYDPENEQIVALHYSEATGKWEILVGDYDQATGRLKVSVDSLSPIALARVAKPAPVVTPTPTPGPKPPTYHEPPKHAYDPDAAIKDDSTDKDNSNTNTNTNNKNNSATTSTSTTSAAKVSPKTGQR